MGVIMKKINLVYEELKNLLEDKKIVVAVSTGIDSMVLLDLLRKASNSKIIVAHVNHHRRVQSDEEQSFLINYCKEHSITIEVKELFFDNTQNFQNNARVLRYNFFIYMFN
jgi:tRNA(Ile)-lysidine synthase